MRITPVSLATERLILRPPIESDLPAIVELLNDRAVACRLRNVPHPFTVVHAAQRLAASVEGWRGGDSHSFAVLAANHAHLIGGIGLAYSEDGRVASVGYWIARVHWGNGYAREAVRRVVIYAFTERMPRVDRLDAHVHVGNEPSRRVLLAADFREVAIEEIFDCGFDGEHRAHRYELHRAHARDD